MSIISLKRIIRYRGSRDIREKYDSGLILSMVVTVVLIIVMFYIVFGLIGYLEFNEGYVEVVSKHEGDYIGGVKVILLIEIAVGALIVLKLRYGYKAILPLICTVIYMSIAAFFYFFGTLFIIGLLPLYFILYISTYMGYAIDKKKEKDDFNEIIRKKYVPNKND